MCMSLLNNEHFTRQLINGIWNCLRVCKDDIYSVVLYSPNSPHPSNSVVNLNIGKLLANVYILNIFKIQIAVDFSICNYMKGMVALST